MENPLWHMTSHSDSARRHYQQWVLDNVRPSIHLSVTTTLYAYPFACYVLTAEIVCVLTTRYVTAFAYYVWTMFAMLTARCGDIRPLCTDTMLADIVRDVTYQWRLEAGLRGHAPRAALCRGWHLEGRKYGIRNLAAFGELAFASQTVILLHP